MSRVFTDQDLRKRMRFQLSGADVHHLKNVLRMEAGDRFWVADRCGFDYLAEILAFRDGSLEAGIVERFQNQSELPVRVTLCQALARGEKMDLLIRQSVELGVASVLAFASDHAQLRLSGDKLRKRMEHWQNIAEAAAKQSGRGMIPELRYAASTEEVIEFMLSRDAAFVPYEGERSLHLREYIRKTLPQLQSRTDGTLAYAVGPEGGYAARELDLLEKAKLPLVSLGPRILRTETAGPAVQAVLAAALDPAETNDNSAKRDRLRAAERSSL